MNNANVGFVLDFVQRLMRPLVKVLLRYGISHSQFLELSKQVYVDVAEQDFSLEGRKQTVSRISVLTGLSRKEVKRFLENERGGSVSLVSGNRAMKVVNAWMRDERYLTDEGIPRALVLDEGRDSFATLVKEFSGDMPVRAVLDELLTSGAVSRDGDNISLSAQAYVPHADDQQKLDILGQSVADLLATGEHNLAHPYDESRLQMSVAYDNLPREVVERFRDLSEDQAQALLLKLNQWLASHDRDVSPQVEGEGRYRAGVGIYYFEMPVQGKKNEKQ